MLFRLGQILKNSLLKKIKKNFFSIFIPLSEKIINCNKNTKISSFLRALSRTEY